MRRRGRTAAARARAKEPTTFSSVNPRCADFAALQRLRDDARDFAAGLQNLVRERAHQAARGASVDQPYAARRQLSCRTPGSRLHRPGPARGSSRSRRRGFSNPWRRVYDFWKRLPGESIGTSLRHSGHSASGHDGTESDSSERAGTENASGGSPRSTMEPTAMTRPPAASTAADGFPRATSGREDVLDDDDGLARLEREAPP